MLRLIQSKTVTFATVDLDGKLVGPWVDEVRAAIAALRRDQAVCLNLEHLSFADAAGFRLLCEMRRDGVQLVGATPLIEGLLAHHRDRAALESVQMVHE